MWIRSTPRRWSSSSVLVFNAAWDADVKIDCGPARWGWTGGSWGGLGLEAPQPVRSVETTPSVTAIAATGRLRAARDERPRSGKRVTITAARTQGCALAGPPRRRGAR